MPGLQDSPFFQIGKTIGDTAAAGVQGYQQGQDARRTEAKDDLQTALAMGERAYYAGDHEAAAHHANTVLKAMGIISPDAPQQAAIVGAPMRSRQQSGPTLPGPGVASPGAGGVGSMPFAQTTDGVRPGDRIGVDYSQPATQTRLAGMFQDPFKETVKDKRADKESALDLKAYVADTKAAAATDRLAQGEERLKILRERIADANTSAAERLKLQGDALDLRRQLGEDKPENTYKKYIQDRNKHRADWVQDAVAKEATRLTRNVRSPVRTAAGEIRQGDFKEETIFPEQSVLDAYRKKMELEYERLNPVDPSPAGASRPDPMVPVGTPAGPYPPNPSMRPIPRRIGGGGAASGGTAGSGGGGGTFTAAPTTQRVPKKWGDVALLPEVEAMAQGLVAAVPGAAISSRARSRERNAAAGGVANSKHQHRQAFDVTAPMGKWGDIIRWAQERGLEALPEPRKNHIHIQVPASRMQHLQGKAPTADSLAAFYAEHGIELGANA